MNRSDIFRSFASLVYHSYDWCHSSLEVIEVTEVVVIDAVEAWRASTLAIVVIFAMSIRMQSNIIQCYPILSDNQ